jgi:hypothetical protein
LCQAGNQFIQVLSVKARYCDKACKCSFCLPYLNKLPSDAALQAQVQPADITRALKIEHKTRRLQVRLVALGPLFNSSIIIIIKYEYNADHATQAASMLQEYPAAPTEQH